MTAGQRTPHLTHRSPGTPVGPCTLLRPRRCIPVGKSEGSFVAAPRLVVCAWRSGYPNPCRRSRPPRTFRDVEPLCFGAGAPLLPCCACMLRWPSWWRTACSTEPGAYYVCLPGFPGGGGGARVTYPTLALTFEPSPRAHGSNGSDFHGKSHTVSTPPAYMTLTAPPTHRRGMYPANHQMVPVRGGGAKIPCTALYLRV